MCVISPLALYRHFFHLHILYTISFWRVCLGRPKLLKYVWVTLQKTSSKMGFRTGSFIAQLVYGKSIGPG